MRKIFISAVAAFLYIFSAQASVTGPLSYTDIKVRRDGNILAVSFSAKASADAVRSGNRLLVTPVLSNSAGAMELDPFVVTGRRMENIERQKALLEKREYAQGRTHIENSETVSYSVNVPFEEWMGKEFELSVRTLLVTCCKTSDKGTSVLKTCSLAPAFVPSLPVSVEPQVSKVSEEVQTRYPFLRKAGTEVEPKRGISVKFPQSLIEIQPDYLGNKESLDEIIDAISLVINDKWTNLDAIDIAGYASPEGEHQMNVTLSQGRADALKDYIRKELDLEDEQFNITAGAEDWAGLRELVVQSTLADKDNIIDIIDNVPQQDRQSALKKLSSGKTYRTLLHSYYPQLRDACYINVWFSDKADVVAEAVNQALDDLNDGQYDAAIEKLMPYKEDSRTWNTLGSAHLLMDRFDQARIWFESASNAGDEDATRNLELLNEMTK